MKSSNLILYIVDFCKISDYDYKVIFNAYIEKYHETKTFIFDSECLTIEEKGYNNDDKLSISDFAFYKTLDRNTKEALKNVIEGLNTLATPFEMQDYLLTGNSDYLYHFFNNDGTYDENTYIELIGSIICNSIYEISSRTNEEFNLTLNIFALPSYIFKNLSKEYIRWLTMDSNKVPSDFCITTDGNDYIDYPEHYKNYIQEDN